MLQLWAHRWRCHWCSSGCVWRYSNASWGHDYSEDNNKGISSPKDISCLSNSFHRLSHIRFGYLFDIS